MENALAQRIELFSQLMECGAGLSYWKLDPELNLIESDHPAPEGIYNIFAAGDCFLYLQEYVKAQNPNPVMLSNPLGMSWIATNEISGENVCRVHMIGPAFTEELSSGTLQQYLRQKKYPQSFVDQLLEQINALPVISAVSWLQFGIMLHYTITGEKAQFSDFLYQTEHSTQLSTPSDVTPSIPKNSTWLSEQAAMQMIEDGRLEYQNAFSKLSESANTMSYMGGQGVDRNARNSIISFITLSTRAAIRGGLDPETAYTIGLRYIQNVETASSMPELMHINNTMYNDFVQRVHKIKAASGVSSVVHACCNYIDLHLSEKISIQQLADQSGYSASRLAQKFKTETGKSIAQYTKERRVEQAKRLLNATSQSIQEISDALGFCNTSYFVETFRSVAGMTPGEYRNQRA